MIIVPGFEDKVVAVFGLGRSGLTAARALKAGGAYPAVWDDSVSGRMQAEAEGFDLVDLSSADWRGIDALVVSPGVPLTHPKPHWVVEKAKASETPILGDIELFARATEALPEAQRPRVVAITGTNGKSTTTALIGWVLRQAGLKVHIGGNIGIGVLALPEPTVDAIYVIEVSSYQLDLTTNFIPNVAILTNMSPDHLDRHGSMSRYVAAKRRLFEAPRNQSDRQFIPILGVDDQWSGEIAGDVVVDDEFHVHYVYSARDWKPQSWVYYSSNEGNWLDHVRDIILHPTQVYYDADRIVLEQSGLRLADGRLIDLSSARSLPGHHNAQNAAFAYAAARALGVSGKAAVEGLLTFPGLAHRMEEVARLGHVRFINDSKATNADAARQALSSYPRSYWIAGGRAKEGGIDGLTDLFARVAQAYLIGEAAAEFADVLDGTQHQVSRTMEAAVAAAAADAAAAGGEQVVLLSPAAASFDQYPDFEARGEAFRAAVLALGATPPSVSQAGAS